MGLTDTWTRTAWILLTATVVALACGAGLGTMFREGSFGDGLRWVGDWMLPQIVVIIATIIAVIALRGKLEKRFLVRVPGPFLGFCDACPPRIARLFGPNAYLIYGLGIHSPWMAET
ncbi:MAG: hypothetical protein IKQ60_08385 [Candidatus Methanomethylophilaceae archaeon]|nr:hypothetical protein [Candidatus Methanomethylophilaceae archaeon]